MRSWLVSVAYSLAANVTQIRAEHQLAADRHRAAGMVAAGHPLAAKRMRILKTGSNAIDAAMATWADAVEPGMTGLGRGHAGPDLHREAGGEIHQRHRLRTAGGSDRLLQLEGGLPTAGRCRSPSRRGQRRGVRDRNAEPSRWPCARARHPDRRAGLPLPTRWRADSPAAAELAKWPSTTKVWFKDGEALQMGDGSSTRNSRGRTRDRRAGTRVFYKGEIAKPPRRI
jgi:hypothetical protein